MKYVDFKNAIRDELLRNPDGLTWQELKKRLELPYDRSCPSWVRLLEEEICLVRVKGQGRALVRRIDR